MKNILPAIFAVFLACIPAFTAGHNTVRQDQQLDDLYKIGSDKVKVLGYELYTVTLHSVDPCTIVARYLQCCVKNVGSEDPVDKLAL